MQNRRSGRAIADPSEADFRADVIRTLRTLGYLATAIRRSDGVTIGDVGLPDVLAVHPTTGAFLALELKVADRHATGHQLGWLAGFTRPRDSQSDRYAPAADIAEVVRPGDWHALALRAAELAGKQVVR